MFDDRKAAGKALAAALRARRCDRPAVYALLRGGVPVAAEVARALGAPLGVIFVRKIGAPGHPEFAIGAVADGAAPAFVLHRDIIDELAIDEAFIANAKAAALREIDRRRALFSGAGESVDPAGRCAIIVDDGLATGATMEAAIAAMRKRGATRIIAAAPVTAPDAVARMSAIADEFVAIEAPPGFAAVSAHYRDFPQLTDAEVLEILKDFPECAPS